MDKVGLCKCVNAKIEKGIRSLLEANFGTHLLVLEIATVVVLAIMAVSICRGDDIGSYFLDALMLWTAFASLYITTFLTLKVKRIEEFNHDKEKKEAEIRKKQEQVASFPQFRVTKCMMYDLNCEPDEKNKYAFREARKKLPTDLQRYLLEIRCDESFPAYYKICIENAKLSIQGEGQNFSKSDGTHCWFSNNRFLTIWINFDGNEFLIENIYDFSKYPRLTANRYLEAELKFSCINFLSKEEVAPLYQVHFDFNIGGTVNNQVRLTAERRYITSSDCE